MKCNYVCLGKYSTFRNMASIKLGINLEKKINRNKITRFICELVILLFYSCCIVLILYNFVSIYITYGLLQATTGKLKIKFNNHLFVLHIISLQNLHRSLLISFRISGLSILIIMLYMCLFLYLVS